MQWIDLSEYGLKLMDVEVPSMTPGVTSRVWVMANGDRHPDECAALGFVRLRNGAWVTPSPTVRPSFADISARFPAAAVVDDVDPARVRMSLVSSSPAAADTSPAGPSPDARRPAAAPFQLEAAREPAAPPPPEPEPEDAATVARKARSWTRFEEVRDTSRYLGVNRRGFDTYDSGQGRFYKDDRDRLTFEVDVTNAPALFLRAPDEAALAACAEGFATEIDSGKILRFEDLRRFAAAVYDGEVPDTDPRLARAHLAIEGALARALARKGGASMRDIFQGAIRMQEGHQYVADLARRQPGTAAMPQTVAVVVQRILGTEAELAGKTVAIVGGGSGALFTHLTRETELRVYEPDPEIAVHAGSTLLSANRSPKTDLLATAPDYSADMVVANLRRDLLDAPRDFGGMHVGRADLAEMMDSLSARAPGGRSVFILQGGGSAEEAEELDRVRARIGREHYIEGTVDVDGGLHSGNPAADPMRLFVVGQRRPSPLPEPHEASMRVSAVASANDMWSWTVDVVNNRAKIAKFNRDIEERALAAADGSDPDLRENSYQTPYQATSDIGQASTMVPRALEGPMRAALGKVAREHGNIDEWVGGCLAMTPEQMADAFAPEQIDAMAMIFDAHDRGRGALNADMTGLGKGRTIAGACRRAVVSGGSHGNLSRALVLTEREINIGDLIRDIRHIKSEDEFSILILNDGSEVVNEDTGEVVMRSERRDVIQAIMETGRWPEQYNLIIATYSQFNKELPTPASAAKAAADATKEAARREAAGEPPAIAAEPEEDTLGILKAKWLRTAVDRQTLVVLDECHNVSSGTSNASANVQVATEACGDVMFSSATYAKAAKNMQIYTRLLPRDFETENLTEVIRRGGETMQETLSAMLVTDGVMIRREHDLSKCKFTSVTDDGADEVTGEKRQDRPPRPHLAGCRRA